MFRCDDQQDGPSLVHCLPACDCLLLVHLEAVPGPAEVQATGDGDESPYEQVGVGRVACNHYTAVGLVLIKLAVWWAMYQLLWDTLTNCARGNRG